MCCEAPDDGSRTTLFASGYDAYTCLSDELKALAVSVDGIYGPKYTMEASVAEMWRRGHRTSEDGLRRIVDIKPENLTPEERATRASTPNKRRWAIYHGPPAKRHPETRRMSLFSSPSMLESFAGLGYEESHALIASIFRPGVSLERVYEHRWQVGDVVLWDNRCMLHSTTPLCEAPNLLLQVFARTRQPMIPPTAPLESAFCTFVRLWVMSVLVRTFTQLGTAPLIMPLWALVMCAAAFPTSPIALCAAFSARLVVLIAPLPYQYDSQLWALQCDLACVMHLTHLLWARSRPPHHTSKDKGCSVLGNWLGGVVAGLLRAVGGGPLTPAETHLLLERTRRTNLAQLGLFYTAAGFWKLNDGFLSPQTSCAPVFFAGLLTRFLPPAADAVLAPALRWLGPALTIAVELIVGTLFLCARPSTFAALSMRRLGLFAAVTFHLLIALTPPPNDIASYGVSVMPRLFLLRPHGILAAARELLPALLWHQKRSDAVSHAWRLLLVAAGAAVARSVHELTTALLVYCAFAAVCYRAAALPACAEEEEVMEWAEVGAAGMDAVQEQAQRAEGAAAGTLNAPPCGDAAGAAKRRQTTYRIHACSVALGFLYAFVALPLGVMDMGSCHMFSNLRVHGGSNHLIAPTGLLQRWLVKSDGVYGGGLVRVEASDSTFLREVLQYPGEVSAMHSERARALMRAAGHTGRHFHPMLFNTPSGRSHAHGEIGSEQHSASLASAPAAFARFTLPAFEFRRLLGTMRAHGAAFTLTYTHLANVTGSETWRANGGGRRIVLCEKGVHHKVVRQCSQSCRVVGGGKCLTSDLGLLPAVDAASASSWVHWPAKLLLSVPSVILKGEVGKVHCYSP